MSPVRLLQTDTQVRDAALELLAGLRPLAEDDEAAAYGHGVERLQEARVEAEGGFAVAPARYELGRRSARGSPGPLPRPCVPGCRGGDRSGCTAALTRSLPSRCNTAYYGRVGGVLRRVRGQEETGNSTTRL